MNHPTPENPFPKLLSYAHDVQERPPRVAVVAKLFPTVSETFVMHHVTGLLDLGYEVDIYAFDKEALSDYGHGKLEEYQLTERLTYLPRDLEGSAALEEMVQRGYSAIHCHFGEVAQRMSHLKRRIPQTRFLVTFHGCDLRLAMKAGDDGYAESFKLFDFVISICDYNKTRLLELGCSREKLVDLPNAVDTVLFSAAPRCRTETTQFISVARLHVDKNLPFALRVMRRLLEAGVQFHYTVAGHGTMLAELQSLILQYGLAEHVTLLGQCSQEQVVEELQRADVFFLPSQAEAAPVCVLEAQSMKLPVVATRVGGVDQLVQDTRSGFLVESGDEPAAAEALIQLANDPVLCREMGERGRRQIIATHDHRAISRCCAMYYGVQPPPRVSVVIPTHNRSTLIDKAIKSVLHQTYQNFEIIVVDDGSTDDTRATVKAWQSRHQGVIRYVYRQKENAAAARNAGIDLARGELVAFLDSDDYWYPDKLARQVEILDSDPGVGFVQTGCAYEKMSSYEPHGMLPLPEILAQNSADVLRGDRRMHMTVLTRRDLLTQVGGFDSGLTTTHDTDLWLKLAEVSELVLIDEVLTCIRWHNSHLSTSLPERKLRDRLIVAKRAIGMSPDQLSVKTWRRTYIRTLLELSKECLIAGRSKEARRLALDVVTKNPFAGEMTMEPGDPFAARLRKLLQPYHTILKAMLTE